MGVTLVDTAGLRDGAERIEALGILRTKEALAGADLAVLLLPPSFTESERAEWRSVAAAVRLVEVFGKSDLCSTWNTNDDGALHVSGETGAGIDALVARLLSEVMGSVEPAMVTSERHLNALKRALEFLERAQTASRIASLEIAGGELTQALLALAEITGEDVSTERLDSIFSRFCIGK